MLAEIHSSYTMCGHKVWLAKKENSFILNGLLTKEGLRGMMDGEKLPFFGLWNAIIFGKFWPLLGEQSRALEDNGTYNVYILFLVGDAGGDEVRDPSRHAAVEFQQGVSSLKHTTVNMLKGHFEKVLLPIRLNLMYHIHY